MQIPETLRNILTTLIGHGAKPIIVGGSVRDSLMGRELKDYDIEVYGTDSMDELQKLLSPFGKVNNVGKSFGVLKLSIDGDEVDFSMPRTERKSGAGHKGFEVHTDGAMDFATAARRRDFTINAIGYDFSSGRYIDPYGGMSDMEQRLLRHIDDDTFIEDPLRVYRAVQFAARFGYELDTSTFKLCKSMVEQNMLDELPKERIYAEWQKLLLRSEKPSIGFELMRELGIIERYFPELYAIIDVPQNPIYHPEGDVWTHTMMALDAMQSELGVGSEELGIGDRDRLRFLFAILCHDLGKATHTTIEFADGTTKNWQELSEENKNNILSQINSGAAAPQTKTPNSQLPTPNSIRRIRAIGHEAAGIEPTRSLLYRLTNEHDLIYSILPLVEYHLAPSQYYRNKAKDKTIRKLSTKVRIRDLIVVARADYFGRGDHIEDEPKIYEAGEWLAQRAKELGVYDAPPVAFLRGQDLLDMGMEPSGKIGEILDEVYQEQIWGDVKSREEALEFVKKRLIQT